MNATAEREAIEQAIRLLAAAKLRGAARHLRSRKMRAIYRREWGEALGLMLRPNRLPAVARWFDSGKLTGDELSALLGTWLFRDQIPSTPAKSNNAHTAQNGSESINP